VLNKPDWCRKNRMALGHLAYRTSTKSELHGFLGLSSIGDRFGRSNC